MTTSNDFDRYAGCYHRTLKDALSVSGEDPEYFARHRVSWLSAVLRRMKVVAGRVMDYGCGTGSTAPLLLDILNAERLVGLDVSHASLEVARRDNSSSRIDFLPVADYVPHGSIHLAYCNGVFHHIPPALRLQCVRFIHESLSPGGLFSFWENNPWNPGTRHIMSRCAFDRDAITLTMIEAQSLLRAGGFEVLRTESLFVFPAFLNFLRPMERMLTQVPIGAQYHVLCKKAAA